MNEEKEAREREMQVLATDLAKYERFEGNEDVQSILIEADKACRVDASVFEALANFSPNATHMCAAQGGARAYSQYLKDLVRATKEEMAVVRAEIEALEITEED